MSASEPGAGPADELIAVLTEIERDVLVREPADLIPTRTLGAEPLRGGILQQSSAFDLGRARLRMARVGALPPLLLGQLSSIPRSIPHERLVPARATAKRGPGPSTPSVGASVAATHDSLPV
jgi:hypothetical protein